MQIHSSFFCRRAQRRHAVVAIYLESATENSRRRPIYCKVFAIWGLESDFGKGDMGKLPVIRTLATLAHDCRRSDLFQSELIAALKIIQRGDLPLRDLIGAYAGEIGQTQFLPSSYIKYGVDFDGDGRVDLRHSAADVLASTANMLHVNGFKMGGSYQEGSENFEAMREWNHAVIYRKTIAYFSDRLIGQQ
jgi:membrane-bound lytic murein transglycosylase B